MRSREKGGDDRDLCRLDAAAGKLKPTVTRIRERGGQIRAEIVHERNLALLSTDAIALDDPGAPTKTRPTAQQRMERARTKPDLIAANRRWTASLSSMPDADRQRGTGSLRAAVAQCCKPCGHCH